MGIEEGVEEATQAEESKGKEKSFSFCMESRVKKSWEGVGGGSGEGVSLNQIERNKEMKE